jgi:hypothetical protein
VSEHKTPWTPGTWRVQDTAGKMYGKAFTIFSDRGNVFVGNQLKPNGISIREARANAMLAKEAPAMAELLGKFHAFFVQYCPEGDPENDPAHARVIALDEEYHSLLARIGVS